MQITDRLPLADYSAKYKISISTLRRRIKRGRIDYSFDEGKYLIKDLPLDKHEVTCTHSELNLHEEDEFALGPEDKVDSDFSTANLLLNELKEAYSVILKEKDDKILDLRHQISDLQTLVQALESENHRLSKQIF